MTNSKDKQKTPVPKGPALSRRTLLGAAGAAAGALALPRFSNAPAYAAGTSPFAMIGVNLASLEGNPGAIPGVPNHDYLVPQPSDMDYLRSRGVSMIRLPFQWARLQPALYGPLDQTFLGFLTTLVDHAGTVGMSVLLDVHNFGSYGSNKIGDGTLTGAHLADLWAKIAGVFAGKPGLAGYDLMNEPSNMPTTSAWPQAAQTVVNAIRAVDTNTTIVVEGDHWSTCAQWTTYNNTLLINDPANNLVYSAHLYLDRDSSGTHVDWP